MSRVVHAEFAVRNPENSIQFFEQVFGWKITKWDGPMEYWMVATGEDGPGIDGAIMRSEDGTAKTINTLGVASLDDAMAAVLAAGGQILTEPDAIPGVGRFVYAQDPEGLDFGMIEPEPAAAGSGPDTANG